MIQIELTSALAFYSAVLCLLVAAIWLYTEFSVRRPQRFLGRQFLWRCAYCGYTYLDESAGHISKCPRCESFNATEGHEAKPVRTAALRQGASTDRPDRTASPRNTSHRKRPHQKRRGPRRRR